MNPVDALLTVPDLVLGVVVKGLDVVVSNVNPDLLLLAGFTLVLLAGSLIFPEPDGKIAHRRAARVARRSEARRRARMRHRAERINRW